MNRKGVSKKTGKPYDFWGCTFKDAEGFCPFTAPGQKATPATESLQSKALAQIQAHLNRIEAKIDAITPANVVTSSPNAIPNKSNLGTSGNMPF